MRTEEHDVCVVGAGPSGLALAYELLKGGASVLLIERDERVGGLSKSHAYNGHVFDTGPKRFHTDDAVVLQFLDEVAQGSMYRIPRSTEVNFLNRYFEWPLGLKDLWRMPLGVAAKSTIDLLRKKEMTDPTSFHQYIRSRYGDTLYGIFFEPYTRKFLRWDVEDIHSDWASTGINRTVVDSRVKTNTSLDLIKGILLPSKVHTEFLYPSNGGFGGFFDHLLSLCQRKEGFRLILSDTINGIKDTGRGLELTTTQGKNAHCDRLVWSGNLNALLALTGGQAKLPYLNTVFYNLICPEREVIHQRSQWIYVSSGNTIVSRLTCMKEFAPYTCPDGYYNVICEVTDSQANPKFFKSPASHTGTVLKELVDMKFLRRQGGAESVHINPVIDTYPIYHKTYLKNFASAAAAIKKFSNRIELLGRSGAFWYNNSDHSIRHALETARKLLGKGDSGFKCRDYFGGVYGRAAESHGE